MKPYVIMCVDHDPNHWERVYHDLAPLTSHFQLVMVVNAYEAQKQIQQLKANNQSLTLIFFEPDSTDDSLSDEFLVQLHQDEFTRDTRKILFSGQMELERMVKAVNQARLDYYIQKPWETEKLRQVTIDQVTTYILSHETDILPYSSVLDTERILEAQVKRQIAKYQIGFLDYSQYSDEQLAKEFTNALYQFFEGNDQTHACRKYSPNHYLTREGQPNDFLWVLAKGEVILTKKNSAGEDQEIMREKQGALIGVMSFVTGKSAFVTSHTTTHAEVIKLDRKMLAHVIKVKGNLLPILVTFLLRHSNLRLQNAIQSEMKLQETLRSLEVTQTRLIESEKMAILGQLIAGVAHELNNPVTAILRGSENLKQNIPPIVQTDPFPTVKALGSQILENAMTVVPLSTAEIRVRTEKAMKFFPSRNVAKKAVQLGLDEALPYRKYLKPFGNRGDQVLNYLNRFHQVGTFLRNIDVCGKRIADIVKGLKNYSRPDSGKVETVDVHSGIEDTLIIFENTLKHYQVIKAYGDLPPIECYPNELQQIWTNLISNAIDATGRQGQLKITTRLGIPNNESEYIEILIEDNGVGISKEFQEKIFELNFTTKAEGDFGLGIGLAICLQIVKRHNGTIAVESELGNYSRFIVTLPCQLAQ